MHVYILIVFGACVLVFRLLVTLLCARIRLVGCWLYKIYVFGRFQILSSGQIRLLEQVGLQKKLHRESNAGCQRWDAMDVTACINFMTNFTNLVSEMRLQEIDNMASASLLVRPN